jgi:hypothetical protein
MIGIFIFFIIPFLIMGLILLATYWGEIKCKVFKKHQYYVIVGGCFAGGDLRLERDRCQYCRKHKCSS